MDNENNIQTLAEMGFSREQASEALEATHNDLTKAIAFLFGEVEDTKGKGTEISPFIVDSAPQQSYDSVSVSNPEDLPDFLGQYASLEASEIPRPTEYELSELVEYGKDYGHSYEPENTYGESNYANEDSDGAEDSEAETGLNVKGPGNLFPVILAKRSGQHKYWVPLLSILSQYAPFARKLMLFEETTPLIQEIQRIVYFVQNFRHSKRWYVSTSELFRLLLDSDEMMFDEEVVLNIYENIMSQEEELRAYFESLVESVEEEICKEITVLEIDSDTRRRTLYQTLNELFWQKGFTKLGLIKYQKVAPIVTYQLVGDDGTFATPFDLQEVVYPEIYSDKALKHVREEVDLVEQAENDRRAAGRRLMELNFFEGKKVAGLLRQSAATLGPESDASTDLAQLCEQMDHLRAKNVDIQANLRIEALGAELGTYDRVVAAIPDLRPYRLLGVIFSDSRYYFRRNGVWVRMEGGVFVDFEEVQADVAHYTRHGSHPVTFIYVEEIESEDSEEQSHDDGEDDSQTEANDRESDSETPEKGINEACESEIENKGPADVLGQSCSQSSQASQKGRESRKFKNEALELPKSHDTISPVQDLSRPGSKTSHVEIADVAEGENKPEIGQNFPLPSVRFRGPSTIECQFVQEEMNC